MALISVRRGLAWGFPVCMENYTSCKFLIEKNFLIFVGAVLAHAILQQFKNDWRSEKQNWVKHFSLT